MKRIRRKDAVILARAVVFVHHDHVILNNNINYSSLGLTEV